MRFLLSPRTIGNLKNCFSLVIEEGFPGIGKTFSNSGINCHCILVVILTETVTESGVLNTKQFESGYGNKRKLKNVVLSHKSEMCLQVFLFHNVLVNAFYHRHSLGKGCYYTHIHIISPIIRRAGLSIGLSHEILSNRLDIVRKCVHLHSCRSVKNSWPPSVDHWYQVLRF